MTTIQQVFDMAIHLMDEQNESSGATVTSDTNEYKVRTISILNTIMPGLYPYSDTYDSSAAGRPLPRSEGHRLQGPGLHPAHPP